MSVRTRRARPRVRRGWELALVAVAAVWGFTFTTVKEAVAHVPVFEFLALRFGLAAVLMTAVAWRQLRALARPGWIAAVVAGATIFTGYASQTVGLQHTTATNAAFVTGLFVVIAPVLSVLYLKRRPGPGPALGVALATVGLFLLSASHGFHLRYGDAIVLGAAVSFAVQLVIMAKAAPEHSPAALSAVQMWVTAVLATFTSLASEHLTAPTHHDVVAGVLITGVLASAGAFWAMTLAQRHVSPTRTAVILVMEPVFAGIAGVVILSESLNPRQWAGAALILAGMLVAELAPRREARESGEGIDRDAHAPPPQS
ncbi:MAG: DMT family transporter [Actinomycetota bacterium]